MLDFVDMRVTRYGCGHTRRRRTKPYKDKKNCYVIFIKKENFIHGQASPRDIVSKFFESLQSNDGANHGQVTTAIRRKSMSAASDDMYAVTNGRLKPSKHLCLRMAFKSQSQPI